ncbi:MAG TPA: 3D domain-containing protein [Kofleriaceae bacterium]|nr:3D domain-containing protein [Kofleriaceae bacterium]
MSTTDGKDQTLLASIGEMAKASAGFLADLVARVVHVMQGVVIAPLALTFGCQASASDTGDKVPAPEVAVVNPKTKPAADDVPKQLGFFNITFYYVVGEDEVVAKAKTRAKKKTRSANDNHGDDVDLAAISPPERVTIYAKNDCAPIAEVTREFAHQLKIQGTGKLKDGRTVNVWGNCSCDTSPCFKVTEQQWGTSGNGRPLQPFRTVAVDPKVVKLGSLLYIPLLEGRTMPGHSPWGGFVHDGCVVADDTGGGIKNQQIDFFVGRKGWFLGMSGSRGSHAWARHVPVFDGSKVCERKGRRVARKTGGV